MPSSLSQAQIEASGSNLPASIWPMDGRSTQLVVTQPLLPNYAVSPRTNAWAEVLAVNTMGPMRVSEAFVEHVASSDRKLIVTLTSGMGSIADNTSGGSIVYRSSKAAVNMVMRSLAIDLAPRGITCVVVNPGWVRTDMGGPNASLEPSESISALRRLIATFGPEQSGKFFNHTGREYPW